MTGRNVQSLHVSTSLFCLGELLSFKPFSVADHPHLHDKAAEYHLLKLRRVTEHIYIVLLEHKLIDVFCRCALIEPAKELEAAVVLDDLRHCSHARDVIVK